jgi:hypothetical protein
VDIESVQNELEFMKKKEGNPKLWMDKASILDTNLNKLRLKFAKDYLPHKMLKLHYGATLAPIHVGLLETLVKKFPDSGYT